MDKEEACINNHVATQTGGREVCKGSHLNSPAQLPLTLVVRGVALFSKIRGLG